MWDVLPIKQFNWSLPTRYRGNGCRMDATEELQGPTQLVLRWSAGKDPARAGRALRCAIHVT
ncbi:conserved hypothetical protein [Xanthomonas phaseoli pv. phaseoli]|uniref:Uncharacterized protein n=1 Tax=Xanthomonas campestris pv. phaseoli TaxID=317013 RepID=A0AB38E725_XANCH|nr:conserved hypothetical protein [Xanthomonas phaseoli pv. phaseoli]SON90920.1 conserved hypothetical protein [Xanthomonas phaseoli pv. phaseoli]SON92715.1 conserved hypothetical protein [Xanthomonas phaseoli pv. phaseoli]SOO29666.1 conserved hypothetical protein [Xanthomonas phaseoli pv. phaseoli]